MDYVPQLGGWDEGFLNQLAIGDLVHKIPPVCSLMGQVVGNLQRKPAASMNLKAGIPVATAGMDSYAAGVGLGVTMSGRMALFKVHLLAI